MTLREIQYEQEVWSKNNFHDRRPYWAALGVCEEIGELAHTILKREQRIRVSESEDDINFLEMDAIGDIVIFLMEFCNQRGYDLQTIIETTWNTVRQRDWKKFPKNGVSE